MMRTSVAGIATAWLFTSLSTGGCGGNDFSTVSGKSGAGGKGGSSAGATGGSGGDAGEPSTGTGGSSGSAAGGAGGTSGDSSGGTSGTSGANGGKGGAGGGGGVSDATCAEYIRAYCEWSARCTDYVYGGSVEACQSLAATSCPWYQLPGIGWTDASFGACTTVLESADCAPTEAICETPRGTLQNGHECLTAAQCESNYCAVTSSYCGVCGPDPKHDLGGECEDGFLDCKPGLDCVDETCVVEREEGETCDDVRHCSSARREEGYLYCVEGTCQVVGRPGEPCIGINKVCGTGSACTTEDICVSYLTAEDGEVCGTSSDEVVLCPDGWCVAEEDDPTVSHCVDWAGPGERCDKVPGFSRCATGLICENELCVWGKPQAPSNACDT
jgi:hypothetical protein